MVIPSDTTMIRLFDTLNLPRPISIPIFRQIKLWLGEMGPETTVSRLKDLKSLYLRSLSGSAGCSSCSFITWVSLHKDGTPKGPFRPLFHLKGIRVRKKVLNALMVYSGFLSSKMTSEQRKKFLTSFEAKPFVGKIEEIIPELAVASEITCHVLKKHWESANFADPDSWITSPKSKTSVFKDYAYKSGKENEFPLEDHLNVFQSPLWYFKDQTECDIYDMATGFTHIQGAMRLPEGKYVTWTRYVGTLSILQEKGMKARVIANPLRVHQMALSRLGNALFAGIRQAPWDCTYDQAEGQRFIQGSLAMEKVVYCFDLSDATNYFPLEVQEYVFSFLKDEEFQCHMRLFRDLARSKWLWGKERNPLSFEAKYLVCTRGQPMGLYPSFPLFALTHGTLLYALETKHGVTNTFRVLGDDVVINHSSVASDYIEVMNKLGVPISQNKSIISDQIGEFAGKIVDVLGPYKVEKLKSFSLKDPLAIYRWLGQSALFLTPRKYRDVLKEWIELPEPVGLGLNPLGKTWDERVTTAYDDLYLDKWLNPGELPSNDSLKMERRRDAILAFKNVVLQYVPSLFRLKRELDSDHWTDLRVEEINHFIRENGWLPNYFTDTYESVRKSETPRRAFWKESKPPKLPLTLFMKYYKQSRRLKRDKKTIIMKPFLWDHD